MNDLLERIKPLVNDRIPMELLLIGLDRDTRHTDTEVGEAMQYVIRNADIGETEEIEIVEIPEPAEAPTEVPAPQPEEEPVPA